MYTAKASVKKPIFSLLIFISLLLFSCKEEITKVDPYEPSPPECYQGPTHSDWLTATVKDSFQVSYTLPLASFNRVCLAPQCAIFHISFNTPFLQLQIGYCNENPDVLCLQNSMYGLNDYIPINNFPDSIISINYPDESEVLRRKTLICKDGETVGVFYYERVNSYNEPLFFVGRLYYVHPEVLIIFIF